MNKLVKRANLEDKIKCDSAGTIAFHEGEQADARMKRHALSRGYRLTSIARRFRDVDFDIFDYIIAMDKANYNDLISFDAEKKYNHKVFMMTDFAKNGNYSEVPDPYYGVVTDFEYVLDVLQQACEPLYDRLMRHD